MSQLSKSQLQSDNNSSFPNNNSGYITPAILRGFNTDMIDSLVDENSYGIDSASFSASIAELTDFSASFSGAFVTPAELDAALAYSASVLQTNINITSASLTGQLNASSSQLQQNINAASAALDATIDGVQAEFVAYTASMNQKTGSFATTGSNTFVGNQIISGALTVTSTASFNGNATANDVSLLLTNSSSLILTSGSSVNVVSPGSITGSVLANEFILPIVAPATPQTGSMYFSGSFIYVYTGTQYRSASLA